jgi:Kelch motif
MYVLGGGCFKPEQSTIDLYCLDLHTLVWEQPLSAGDVPKSRVAHSCSYDAETSTIYLWGGFTSELSRLQDFYAFDCATGVWTDMNSVQEAPVPQSSGASQQLQAQSVQLQAPASGGTAALPLPAAAALAAPVVPPARAFHSAVFHKGALYVFSGANGDVRYSDVWRYQVRRAVPALSMLAAHALAASCCSSSDSYSNSSSTACSMAALPQELAAGLQSLNLYAERLC